uniref:Halobacterial output domain-containing protein n=1 Tax=Natrinema halophilum TaxID=1699371 RepID=A0A7D5GJ94_9EURY
MSELEYHPTRPDVSGGSDSPRRVECRFDRDTPPSIAIVRAIAVIEDIDPTDSPTDLGITLYDHVDPAALDSIVTSGDTDSTITIDLTIRNDHQYSIRVQDTGRLVVEKTD